MHDEKTAFQKILPILITGVSILIAIGGISWLLGREGKTPYGNISNDAYLTANSYVVTDKDWYHEARYSSINIFVEEIDEFMLKETLDKIEANPSDYDQDYEDMMYSIFEEMVGKDWEDVSPDLQEQYINSYIDNLILAGVDIVYGSYPDLDTVIADSEIRAHNEVNLAKWVFTKEKQKDYQNDPSSSYYINDEDAETYYEDYFKNDQVEIEAIIVQYDTVKDYTLALDDANMCRTDGDWYSDPDGDSESCESTQTKLTHATFTTKMETLYNKRYPYDSGNGKKTYTYSDIAAINSGLATKVSDSIVWENEDLNQEDAYLHESYTSGSEKYLFVLTAEPTVTPTEYDKDIVIDQMIDDRMSMSFANSQYNTWKNSNMKIEIFDPVYEDLYRLYDPSYKNKTWFWEYDKNVVAEIKNTSNKTTHTITPDDLYDEMIGSLSNSVSLSLLTERYLKDTTYYTSITKEQEKNIKKSVKTDVSNFKHGGYGQAGYPAAIGEDAFLASKYRADDLDEAIEKQIYGEALNNFFYDLDEVYKHLYVDANNNVYTQIINYVDWQYNNYFSMDISHVLLSVDYDRDGQPDNYFDVRNGALDSQMQALANNIESTAEGLTGTTYENLNTTVSDYNSVTLLPSPGYSGNLSESTVRNSKQKGIEVKVENLGVATSVNSGFVEEFNHSLNTIYNSGSAEAGMVYSSIVGLNTGGYTTTYTVTQFGYHVIGINNINTDDKPSAKCDNTIEECEDVDPTSDLYNTTDLVTEAQIRQYLLDIEETAKNPNSYEAVLTSDVSAAVATYFTPIFARLNNTYHREIALYNYFETNMSLTFTDTSATDRKTAQIDAYKRSVDGYNNNYDASNPYLDWWTNLGL